MLPLGGDAHCFKHLIDPVDGYGHSFGAREGVHTQGESWPNQPRHRVKHTQVSPEPILVAKVDSRRAHGGGRHVVSPGCILRGLCHRDGAGGGLEQG
jgi:hypothetical protein